MYANSAELSDKKTIIFSVRTANDNQTISTPIWIRAFLMDWHKKEKKSFHNPNYLSGLAF